MKYMAKKVPFLSAVGIIGMLAFFTASAVCAEPDAAVRSGGVFNVAVLHGSYLGGLHMGEYDHALKKLGWKYSKYRSSTEDMERLAGANGTAGELPQYDMVLFCPLFGYTGKKDGEEIPINIDMRRYGEAFRKFVVGGGAVIIPDALYPGYYDWLTTIDPSLGIGKEPCCATREVQNTLPTSPFRFLPNSIREDNTWGHLVLPDGSGWEVLANCGEAKPSVVMKRVGKGFVYVCVSRILEPELLENFCINLELQRMGLAVAEFDSPRFTVGNGHVDVTLKCIAEKAAEAKGVVTITPLENQGDAEIFEKTISIPAGAEALVSFPYTVSYRGSVNITVSIAAGEHKAAILTRDVVIPPLLSVSGPRYRGFVVENELKKSGVAMCAVDLAPSTEKVSNLTLRVSVADKDGTRVGEVLSVDSIADTHFLAPVKIGLPEPGAYVVKGELFENGKLVETAFGGITVLSDKECPVYINDNMNMVVDGKEFFVLGIYKVNPKFSSDIAALGFNTVHVHSWFFDRAFSTPLEYGLKVLYEQNFRWNGDDWLGQTAVEFSKKYSNALMWCGMDEALPYTVESAKKIRDIYHKWDTGHPTYIVSRTPGLFSSQVSLGDVFVAGCYPYNKLGSDISEVSRVIDAARDACKGGRPVFLLSQCFGGEPPAVLRAIAYQGIIHEARGVMWYPWDESDGQTGLRFNSELRAAMKRILSEIQTLSPALLNGEGRRQFKSEDGGIHGLFCREKSGRRYVLLVNPSNENHIIDLSKYEELKGVPELKDAFGSGTVKTDETLLLKQYETKALRY